MGTPARRRAEKASARWYSKAIAYWQGVEASTEGVLGGYGCVNDADVKGSDAFLRPLLAERFGAKRHLVALGELGSAPRAFH
ncbi:hypothetical protein ZWY2020_030510 [Hordeum vulgare]|nr:hypothetical protein ZWY2020_030510 [Hordeum vulgare]